MASSFVALSTPPASASPSIVLLGTPATPSIEASPSTPQSLSKAISDALAIFVISPSVVAYGADAIPTTSETVASIDDVPARETNWRHMAAPLVIRGGTIGTGAATPAPQVEIAAGQDSTPSSSRRQEPQPAAPPAAAPSAPAEPSPPTLQPK